MSDLTHWTYKRSHSITSGTTLTDYQVKIRVYRTEGTSTGDTVYLGSKCLADYGDIRFVASDDTTELSYWMEINAGSYADFWVKLDSITTSATFYIYYGNSSATTTSNGDTTFKLFDAFETLDTDKWGYSTGVTPTISSGILSISYTSGAQRYFYSKNYTHTNDVIVHAKVKVTTGSNVAVAGCINPSTTTEYALGSAGVTTTEYLFKHTSGTFASLNTYSKTSGNTSNWFEYIIAPNPGTLKGKLRNYDVDAYPTSWETSSIDSTLSLGYIGLTFYNASSGAFTCDWIFVRTYTTTDPIHSTWGAEQDLSATSFTIRITPTTGTNPLSVTYNCIIPEGTLDNFTLSYGDGNEYTAATQSLFATTHTYNEPGTYTVWGEGYTEFATHVYYEIPYGVNVSAPSVVASFTTSQSYNTITFTNTSTGNINECYWDFGDGRSSYEQNPVHTYWSPATYNVTLYTSNQYQYSATTIPVTITQVLTPPSAYFTPARLDVINPTLPYNVTFTNLSTPTFGCTYDWTVDGSNVSTSENPSISFATHGVYDIGLTVTNALGSSSRVYNDAIRLTRKSRTMNEVVGGADTFSTFGVQVFLEYATSSDLPIVYATILPEGVYFIQREIPDVPGIDEWGVRHLYSTINEWGIKIFNTINSWGHKILHNSSSVDRTPLRCIDVEIFEETIIVSDDHQFDEDPS